MSKRWKDGVRALAVSWGALTLDERKVLCLILALACLGLGAKAWHQHRIDTQAPPPAVERLSPR